MPFPDEAEYAVFVSFVDFFCCIRTQTERRHGSRYFFISSVGVLSIMTDSQHCKFGCGNTVCPGKTKKGNPYNTCCRNCVQSNGSKHDNHCKKRNGIVDYRDSAENANECIRIIGQVIIDKKAFRGTDLFRNAFSFDPRIIYKFIEEQSQKNNFLAFGWIRKNTLNSKSFPIAINKMILKYFSAYSKKPKFPRWIIGGYGWMENENEMMDELVLGGMRLEMDAEQLPMEYFPIYHKQAFWIDRNEPNIIKICDA